MKFRHLLGCTALVPVGALLFSSLAVANPTGGKVVAGHVTIAPGGSHLTVTQGSNRAVINWSSFSIAKGETARFNLPSSTAAILNRVTGPNLSSLLGSLYSNGQVYLLNPNGIVIGRNGRVNTAGFIASTGNITNRQFMQGGGVTLRGNSTAGIVVLGSVKANDGDVLLVAAQVDNGGKLIAPNGKAILAAGSEVLYVPGQYANIAIAAPAPAHGAAVSNTGLIKAASAQLAAAGTPYQLAVNNGGQISATRVGMVGGHVMLEAGNGDLTDSGTIAATSGTGGGSVSLTAGRIALTKSAAINVAAPAGAGSITLAATKAISVAKGARLDADATESGNGGTISVKAGAATQFAGTATARGGTQGGNGGQAEISAPTLLDTGTTNLSAPSGTTGSLLLDPDAITIVSGNAAPPPAITGGLWGFTQNPGAQTISVGAIDALLAAANLELQATGTLTVASPVAGPDASIASATTNALTLTAPTIAINAPISLPNGTLAFNWPASAITAYGNPHSLTSASAATLTAKTIDVEADYPMLTLSGAVVTPSLQFTSPTGQMAVSIANPANAIQAVSFDPANTGNAASSLDLETSSALTVSGNLQMSFASTILAGGDLTLAAGTVLQGGPTLSLVSTGGVFDNLAGSSALVLGNGQSLIYSATNGTGASGTAFNDGGLGAAARGAGNFGTQTGITYPANPNRIDTLVEYFATGVAEPTLTISANSFTRTYGQPDPTFTASYSGGSGGGAGELTTLPSFRILQGSDVDAGTYQIQPYGAASAVDLLAYADGNLFVNPAPLVVTANSASMTYGGAVPTLGYGLSGLVNGDTSAIVSGVTLSSAASSTASVGGYTVTAANATVATPVGGTQPNYTVTYRAGSLTINPAPLTVIAVAESANYGATVPTPQLTFSGFVNAGDAASVPAQFAPVVGAEQGSNAGTYAITLANPNPNANYATTYIGANLTIDPVALTITPNLTRAYGATLPATLPAADYSGFVNGDTSASLTAQPGISTSATVASGIGTYAVTASGAVDPNYIIGYRAGTLAITPAVVTITPNLTTIYGGAIPTSLPTTDFSGFVNGETPATLTAQPTLATAGTASSNVGTYAVTAAGAAAANYTFVYDAGSLAITPAPLQITANAATRTYGDANPNLTAAYSGLRNGDTGAAVTGLTLSTAADAASNVGTYAINATGASAHNYSITYASGVLTVTPAPLSINADGYSRTYGQPNPSFAAFYSGFKNSDGPNVVSGLTFGTAATQASGVGMYVITPSGASAQNYSITYQPGSLLIVPSLLAITANSYTIETSGTLPTLTGSFSGFVGADTQQSTGYGFTDAMVGAPSLVAGTYPISLTGSDPNYSVTFTQGVLTINQVTVPSVLSTPTLSQSQFPLQPTPTTQINTGQINNTATVTINNNANAPLSLNADLFVGQTGAAGLIGALGYESSTIIQDYINAMAANGVTVTQADVTSELNDPQTAAATQALLMPFIFADLKSILNTKQSDWTANQADFVQRIASFIQAQKQAAAQQAENDYAAWHEQQVKQEVAAIESAPGVAGQEMAAIEASNPPVPPDWLTQEASAGIDMSGPQLASLAGIQAGTKNLALVASDSSDLAGFTAGVTGDVGAIAKETATVALLVSGEGFPTNKALISAIPALNKVFKFARGNAVMDAQKASAAAKDAANIADEAEKAAVEGLEIASEGLEIGGLVGKAFAIGGTIAEVAGNVLQIAVGAAMYGSIDTFNTKFNNAINQANQPVTVATLQGMMNSNSGSGVYSYLEAAVAAGGATPSVMPTTTPPSVYESTSLD